MPVAIYRVQNDSGQIVLYNNLFNISDEKGVISSLQTYPIAGLTILVTLLSLVTLFMFKNRKRQLVLTRILNLSLTGLIVLLYVYSDFRIQTIASGSEYSTTFLLGAYAPLLSIFLVFLAAKAIKKDEELVRSADRLR